MAKKTYVGVNNVARNVSKMYVGVNGVARRVKKAYVGVNGVARLFLKALVRGFRFYSDNTIALSIEQGWYGNYEVFNGKYWWIYSNTNYPDYYLADRFTEELTKESKRYPYSNIGKPSTIESVTNGVKLYIQGSDVEENQSKAQITISVDKNDAISYLSIYRAIYKTAVRVDKYALFGGGRNIGTYLNTVICYDQNSTISYPTTLNSNAFYLASASFADNSTAIFWGGQYFGLTYANAYNSSLTRSLYNIGYTSAASFGTAYKDDHVMFGGGMEVNSSGAQTSNTLTTCFILNKSGTKTNISSLSSYNDSKWLRGINYDDCAIIPISNNNLVDMYNGSLTKSSFNTSVSGGAFKAPGRIGDYLAINMGHYNTTIDLFTPIY